MSNNNKTTKQKISDVRELVAIEIEELNEFPLTELQQRLVNYLHANVDDIIETLDIV
jgi:hypothetical protein